MCHANRPTMKRFSLTMLSFVFRLTCFGQAMFFDNLATTTWLSSPDMTDSIIQESKQISLRKMKLLKDSLKENVTIWNFTGGLLTINYFDVQQKTETALVTYKYVVNSDKGILTLYFNDKVQGFTVGITSTGSNALLIRKKDKRKKSTGT